VHSQLESIVSDLHAATARAAALAAHTSPDRWIARPADGGWSAAECLAHLNLTSEAMLPLLQAAIAQARALGGHAPRRYRRDLLGWIVWRSLAPGGGMRTRTKAAFVPGGSHPAGEVLATFEGYQAQLVSLVASADGLPLQAVKVASPFDARARYNAFAALTIVARHQHRHLLQAERAATSPDR
jgi:hypothetical protein